MLPPLPRRSGWAYYFARSPNGVTLPRKGRRVGLRIVLFEACSAFPRVTACTLAPSPIRDALSEGFSHFVPSIAAPVASGWSGCRVGLAPTGKRRLVTAHTRGRRGGSQECRRAFPDGSGPKRQQSLEKNGYRVTIVQEPLTSRPDDVSATKRIRELQDGPVLAMW